MALFIRVDTLSSFGSSAFGMDFLEIVTKDCIVSLINLCSSTFCVGYAENAKLISHAQPVIPAGMMLFKYSSFCFFFFASRALAAVPPA